MTPSEMLIAILEYNLKTCEDCKYCVKKECKKGYRIRSMCGDICGEFAGKGEVKQWKK